MPKSDFKRSALSFLRTSSNRRSSASSEEEHGSVTFLPSGPRNKSAEEDAEHAGNCCTKAKNWFISFPKATWPILLTEFGERFSYYGIKTVLVLYLTKDLMFNKANGKSIYHAFSMTSYFTGVIGAMIADSWLGKYRTIAYTLFLYSISEILLTLTSVDTIGQRNSVGPLISLFAMAIACGNIKPCLAAFGGDQFRKDQEHMLELFFAMFYASVNVGAVLCMWFIPMVRTDVQCFGRDCYPVVFAINTVLIITATLSLVAGKRLYTLKDPAGNVMIRVFKIIWHALSNKFRSSGPTQVTHWLDNANDEYEQKEINDIKLLLRVLKMYIPLPVFWALFHQQGSSWTLQAEQMDGDLGGFTLRSDQIQALNPILVLILIPLYDGRSDVFVGQAGLMNFTVTAQGNGCNVKEKRSSLQLDDKKVFSAVVEIAKDEFVLNKYPIKLPDIDINKAETRVRVIYSGAANLPERVDVEFKSILSKVEPTVLKNIGIENSSYSLIATGEYYINTIMHATNGAKFHSKEQNRKIKFGNFGGYTVVIRPPEGDYNSTQFDTSMYEDAPGTTVSRLLQVPQYVVLTASEVMFSVTGLGFAYSQAPASMKSVLQSFWLLTVAFGDLIVVILASVLPAIGVELGENERNEEKENLEINGIALEDRHSGDNTKV
ncbi:hypothetical protein pdam_00011389 [Pocillopora damicornis]|uniref:Solute carrier family 15 member 2 n=1 Tax=Pocillopora damicornis TaxID=46731 RepID=A0A3M6T7F0_POCDA|nr:hypothetical protein pdam_00011389 [Pocillopora damicornis]